MFGTSGIRGPVGETITTTLALRLGRALGADADRVVVGRDVRDSGRMLEHALIAGLEACGCSVDRLGIESTPTIARSVPARNAEYGVSITGSHNPTTDNGFKFWTHRGRAFDREQYRSVIRRATAGTAQPASAESIGSTQHVHGARERHEQWLASRFRSLGEGHVVVDLGNGTGRLTADILDRLGWTVTTLNSHRDGTFPGRPSEPTASACSALSRTVTALDADLGIAHDADADRLRAVDETGRVVPGDELFALFASQFVERHRTADAETRPRVAVTVDTSDLVADVVSAAGGEVVRTAVGDSFVADAVEQPSVGFGGEPSGIWIWDGDVLCPDAHLAACRLAGLVATNGPLSRLCREYTGQYTTLRTSHSCRNSHETIERARRRMAGSYDNIDTTDGIRISTDGGWFLIRASGTEPVVRLTAEAADEATARRLFERAKQHVEPPAGSASSSAHTGYVGQTD